MTKKVMTLLNATWNGNSSPSGIYFVRMEAAAKSTVKKLLLVK